LGEIRAIAGWIVTLPWRARKRAVEMGKETRK